MYRFQTRKNRTGAEHDEGVIMVKVRNHDYRAFHSFCVAFSGVEDGFSSEYTLITPHVLISD